MTFKEFEENFDILFNNRKKREILSTYNQFRRQVKADSERSLKSNNMNLY